MYVYLTSDQGEDRKLYTVGFYTPAGNWVAESDHSDREVAAQVVNYLNGGAGDPIGTPDLEA